MAHAFTRTYTTVLMIGPELATTNETLHRAAELMVSIKNDWADRIAGRGVAINETNDAKDLRTICMQWLTVMPMVAPCQELGMVNTLLKSLDNT